MESASWFHKDTVILKHLGTWYKVNNNDAIIISFLMDYEIVKEIRYGNPKVGFPESSIDKVVYLLEKNKINYMLKYDDDKFVDFKEENNYQRFLNGNYPDYYVTVRGEYRKPKSGSFIVQYEGEEPQKYVIGEDINEDAELTKKVIDSNIGEIISINGYNVKIIEKDIE